MSADDGSGSKEKPEKGRKHLSDSKRFSRNLSEKKRRNRFNVLVDELAHCVLSKSNIRPRQKLEKSAILELAVNFLKENQAGQSSLPTSVQPQTASSSGKLWQPSFLSDREFNQIMQESMDGFVFVLDNTGKVLYVSDGVFLSLGRTPDRFLDSSVLEYVHRDDQETILTHLKTLEQSSSSESPSALTFVCRMSAADGCFISLQCSGRIFPTTSFDFECGSTGPRDSQSGQVEGHRSMCLVVLGKLAFPRLDKTLFTASGNSKEFTYRLTMDWKYIFLDQSASFIIGFFPAELIHKSAYDFIHPDDLKAMEQYHEMLTHLGRANTCYYRQMTKGCTWVWLRSSCYVSYNQWSSKPDYIMGTASIATYAEVCANQKEILNKDTEKFAKVIASKFDSQTIFSNHSSLVSSSEHSEQLMGESNEECDFSVTAQMSSTSENDSGCHVNSFTTNDERLNVQGQTGSCVVDGVNTQTPQQLCEIGLPDPGLTQGLSQQQLEMHNQILQDQSQRILESIQRKEHQLVTIQRLMQWSKQLVEMYEKVADASV